MGIFSKKDHTHDDPRVRLEAVEKLSDQEALVEVACEDDSPRVRMAAVARIEGDEIANHEICDTAVLFLDLSASGRRHRAAHCPNETPASGRDVSVRLLLRLSRQ